MELAPHLIAISLQSPFSDPKTKDLARTIQQFLQIAVEDVQIIRLYRIYKHLTSTELEDIVHHVLLDPMTECRKQAAGFYNWSLEIRLKSNLTDNLGITAQISIEDFLGKAFAPHEKVRSSTCYLLKGPLSLSDVNKIGRELLANPLIEEVAIVELHPESVNAVAHIDLSGDDHALMQISQTRQLALNHAEMKAIQTYFQNEKTKKLRINFELSDQPTDVELEAIAQTWSEHCKHKIFQARIQYSEEQKKITIDNIFSTYIKRATEQLSNKIDWLVSVFKDNAGVIRFNDACDLACKVETHNSPSALDPYGGALTGILGVNRDILGTGSGARPIANMDVLCFAPPDYAGVIPEKLLHPKRILMGVVKGIEHGGNKSGIPTINGSILFDERFLGKPLVYCGTLGLLPASSAEKKEIFPGDLVAIAGGKTGRDGIHGATFSSEELHEHSPSSAVQIGDPFTQKKLHDFLLEAQSRKLYRTLTDNGAGGLSSSVGEMAQLSGGCEIDLQRVPLKDPQLRPWEILLSESQERMTFAVPPECKKDFEELAAFHEVAFAFIGTFTNSGLFHVLFEGRTIALLSLSFLHEGVPQLQLEAEWKAPNELLVSLPPSSSLGRDLHQLLSRYTICSKETIVRQYDHEVQGGSCLKPFVGVCSDGPSDASILLPIECIESKEGIVVSNGICPRYSEIDTHAMASYALNEAICNQVAVGADPARIAILDNFCWPDPIYHPEKTPDGKHKLAQLVRAAMALYEGAMALEIPIISGKDSMKNDYKIKNVKISIPPTLLITAIGKIPCIDNAVSMDVKQPGDLVYVAGWTKNELGGSEYFAMKQWIGGKVPRIQFLDAKKLYRSLFAAIQLEMIASCHDCSEGGLGVAMAESAFAGGYGIEVDLRKVPLQAEASDAEILFSESAGRFVITIDPRHKQQFEQTMQEHPVAQVGMVRADDAFMITGIAGRVVLEETLSSLKQSWQYPLRNI